MINEIMQIVNRQNKKIECVCIRFENLELGVRNEKLGIVVEIKFPF